MYWTFGNALIFREHVCCRQEHVLSDSPLFFNPIMNVIGTSMIKYVNMYANSLNSFPIYDQSMQVLKKFKSVKTKKNLFKGSVVWDLKTGFWIPSYTCWLPQNSFIFSLIRWDICKILSAESFSSTLTNHIKQLYIKIMINYFWGYIEAKDTPISPREYSRKLQQCRKNC